MSPGPGRKIGQVAPTPPLYSRFTTTARAWHTSEGRTK
jgi:hypothetical protein